jgi:hypothetical protein
MLFMRLCFVFCASCDNKQPGAATHVHVIWWSSNVWWTEATLITHRKGSVGSLCCAFCSLLSGIHLKWRLQSNPVTQKSFFVTTYYKSHIYLPPSRFTSAAQTTKSWQYMTCKLPVHLLQCRNFTQIYLLSILYYVLSVTEWPWHSLGWLLSKTTDYNWLLLITIDGYRVSLE